MKKRTLAAIIVGMAVVLTACGNSNNPSSKGATFNNQDVASAQQMIPHHRQAVEMAKLADTRAASDGVKTLATAIDSAQGPEITKMQGWLKKWNKPAADSGMSGMDHGSTSDGSMAGMMSDSDMKSLGGASGAEFDTMFLTMMIQHHQGAITMAESEIAKGKDPESIALATTIRNAQTSEIATMKKLLKQ